MIAYIIPAIDVEFFRQMKIGIWCGLDPILLTGGDYALNKNMCDKAKILHNFDTPQSKILDYLDLIFTQDIDPFGVKADLMSEGYDIREIVPADIPAPPP